MIIPLLLLLTINTHNLSQAASQSNSLITFERIAENKQIVMEYIEPISASLKWRGRKLATTSASSVTHVFSGYTKDMIKLNKRFSDTVSAHTATLSTAYIDELLCHAKNRTISVQDMHREIARSVLCLAERIEWSETNISQEISITPTTPLSRHAIYFQKQLREEKTATIIHLLYAVCFSEHPLTHAYVFDCLDALGFMPKIKPDKTINQMATDDPLDCESYKLVAKDFYALAIEELTFIKQHLSFLAPTNADKTANPAYCHALLTQFHVKQKEYGERPAEEKKSFCFDNQLAKVLLLLDHHYPCHKDRGIHVPKYADIIRWRFNLFTKIEA